MNKTLIVILLIFAYSCGSPSSEQQIKQQIEEYKGQISDIESKIANLEQQLSNDKQEATNILVELKTLQKKQFAHYVEVSAILEAVNSAFISPEIGGQIQTIHVSEGEYVKKGQLLVSLNADIIDATIKELEASYDLAKVVFDKQSDLWSKNIGSEIQYLEAKTKKESLESKLESLKLQKSKSKILAPISGIVDEINIKKGELASPGFQIIQLVDIKSFYANADVSEKYISAVKQGDKITIKFPSFKELTIDATIFRIGNIIKSANRTFAMQSKIRNINNMLKPNMLATVRFQDFVVDNVIAVPSILVKKDFKGKYIFIAKENGNNEFLAHKVYVQTSHTNNTETIITKGLNEGDIIIMKGYNLVKNGDKVISK